MANWRFDRIPEKEFAIINRAIDEKDLKTLYLIERKYSVSTVKYCCPSADHLNWFRYGKEQGYY